jgi:hypothetical protein
LIPAPPTEKSRAVARSCKRAWVRKFTVSQWVYQVRAHIPRAVGGAFPSATPCPKKDGSARRFRVRTGLSEPKFAVPPMS